MREIKFRGKLLNSKEFVYGSYFNIMNEDVLKISHYILDSEKSVFIIDIETLGQFTGLKDKNGVEIYEGDILKVYYGEFLEPSINEVKWQIEFNYSAFDLVPCIDFADSNSLQYATLLYEVEVIGNIHDGKKDNPFE